MPGPLATSSQVQLYTVTLPALPKATLYLAKRVTSESSPLKVVYICFVFLFAWLDIDSETFLNRRRYRHAPLSRKPFTAAEESKKRRPLWFSLYPSEKGDNTKREVLVDAAHGVGAPKMEALAKVRWIVEDWLSNDRAKTK